MKNYIILFALLLSVKGFAQTEVADSTKQFILKEIVISSTKETNELRTLPASISVITPQMIEERQIASIVDLSAITPNFYIPDYGSKMSTPVYIRGIGERSTGQAIGLYIDNMPYLNKSVFNFEFMDVQRIELLRGPQGTLYGRNAMNGIVNIFTYSPLDYERTKLALSAGNYGLFRANTSIARKIGKKAGVSLSGYYDGNQGYFENQFDKKRADRLQSAGGRFRFDWRPIENWTIQLNANYDYSEQGAFPYGKYNDGTIEQPNYDHAGRYLRQIAGSNMNLEYKNKSIVFTSSTGFQYFDDDMHMDTDYSPQSVFTLNQLQTNRNWIQEFAVKSNTKQNYQWSFGAFGFNSDLSTDVVTTMKQGALTSILQPVFPSFIKITDEEIPIPGTFKTPAYGVAVFHQSTYNNLFVKGLSLTAGIRWDYEKTKLDYNTSMKMNLLVTPPMPPGASPIETSAETLLVDEGSVSYTEWLPKLALKYAFNEKNYVYVSAAKGHKAGGYNIQMFADIVREIVMEKRQSTIPIGKESRDSILAGTSYQPEYSWNYELGFKGDLIKNVLRAEAAVFYVDVNDVQITQFVESGQGRQLKNAGRAESIGLDLGLTAHLWKGLSLSLNYGYAHAVLKDYKKDGVDYSGKFIPFAPQNTFSFGAGYNHLLRNSKVIDRFNIHAQYNGAGRIYWTEANDVWQDFYGLLNLKAGISKGIFGLNVWTRNCLNTDYATFYFETGEQSNKQSFAQKGAPFQIGVDLLVSF